VSDETPWCPTSRPLTLKFDTSSVMYTPAVVDLTSARLLIALLAGWLNRRQQEGIPYLIEENQIRRGQLRGRHLRLTDDERRRLTVRGQRLDRRTLADFATIVTPDTVTAAEMRAVAPHRHEFHGDWNYEIRPRTT
jgi:hypothetical protein